MSPFPAERDLQFSLFLWSEDLFSIHAGFVRNYTKLHALNSIFYMFCIVEHSLLVFNRVFQNVLVFLAWLKLTFFSGTLFLIFVIDLEELQAGKDEIKVSEIVQVFFSGSTFPK